uniref:Uncharacterized protein n=1 Tax=Steinernema glaseri TaxID=37863 RepID=A0A1I7ZIZ3_9BILA
MAQFVVDTTIADVQVTLCSSGTPSGDEEPCFDHFRSSSFFYTSAVTAHERFDSVLTQKDIELPNIIFMIRPPPTTDTGRIGVAWPSLRMHPEDSSFALEYLKHWPRRQFSIALALDGLKGPKVPRSKPFRSSLPVPCSLGSCPDALGYFGQPRATSFLLLISAAALGSSGGPQKRPNLIMAKRF